MRKGNKRTAREADEGRVARPRVHDDDAPHHLGAEEDEEEATRLAQQRREGEAASTTSEDEEVWEDDEGDDEEEVIDEGSDGEDDDEYAEFQKETEGALAHGMRAISFGEDDAAAPQDDTAANLMVWRNDPQYKAEHAGEEEDEDGGGEVKLEYANKAYDSFFQLRTEYPCLSFDVVRDREGSDRTKYPLSMMLVCGTQADELSKNQLVVLHISNICRTKHDVESDEDSDESYIGDGGESEDEDEDEDEGGSGGGNAAHNNSNNNNNNNSNEDKKGGGRAGAVNDGEPIVHHRTITHYGTANRVRCDPAGGAGAGEGSRFVAVWSDAGYVQIFDLDSDVRALADFANWSKEQARAWREADKKTPVGASKRTALKFCTPSSAHKTEGYGLDWSVLQPHVFASGDCNGAMHVWQPGEDGRWRSAASNTAAGAMSVEEIQWSPTQAGVLIAARAGGAVEVWDTRDMRRSKLAWQADSADINVADWNCARPASHLLVTGSESGMVAVWDLRKLTPAEPIQRLQWHTKSITSVEFSLHNESVLAVTGDDGQCTLWDLSLERDPSEEQEVIGELFGRPDLTGIPDQLMFQHQGLTHPKEVHWHAQIPGMVVTTDYDGLHLFRPMNWRSLMK